MGQKNTKGTVTIINASGRIRLRWRFKAIRYSISLGAYTKSNLFQARIIALKMIPKSCKILNPQIRNWFCKLLFNRCNRRINLNFILFA
jgi:hypothetical protein